MNTPIRALANRDDKPSGPPASGCILCGLSGPGCPYHGSAAA